MAENASPQSKNDIDHYVAELKNINKDTRLKAIRDLEKKDTKLQKESLDALLEAAKDDPDPYVKKQAWILCKKILDSLWVAKDEMEDFQEDRYAVFSRFLAILKEEDQDDWEVQRAAADWLMENAKEINQNKLAFDALGALLVSGNKENDPNVLKSTISASEKIWDASWQGQQQVILHQVLRALESKNWQIRQAAADWLKSKADEIAEDKRMMVNILQPLIEIVKDDNNTNTRESAWGAVQAIWKKAWDWVPPDTPNDGSSNRQVVLSEVLKALNVDEDDDDWVVRRDAANWIESRAEDIAKDVKMVAHVLEALLTRVDEKEDNLYVRDKAIDTIKTIWEVGWKERTKETILDQVLKTLSDKHSWQVRKATADWLGEKSKEIADNERMTTSALDALLERAKKDSHPAVRMSAVNTSQEIWNADWKKSPQINLDKFGLTKAEDYENRQDFILVQVLKPLRFDTRTFWEIRKAAADWLREYSKEIVSKPYETYKEVADTLNLAAEGDPEPEVRNSAKTALDSLWKYLKNEQKKYQNDIKSKIKEDEKTFAIKRLADPITLGSREAMVALVEYWIDRIKEGGEERFVELTAEAIRNNKYAILPLVEQYKKHRDKTQQTPWFRRVVSPSQRSPATQIADGQEIIEPQLRVRRRIARQLAAMSDRSLFDLTKNYHIFDDIVKELRQHAVPVMVKMLPEENDIEILEDVARTLARTRDREAVEALVKEVVGVERERKARQDLIAEYYLKPSKEQSDQATKILGEAVAESRVTLHILQLLNSALFVVGLAVLATGLYISFTNEDGASRVAGALAGIGGLGGMIQSMVKKPLNRIQNAIANMVQMQTAFTSFIWEMNANGTYIQSRYVINGKLENRDIRNTVTRMENSMEKTIDLVSTYVEEGVQRTIIRIDEIIPSVREAGRAVTIHGQHLLGDNMQQNNLVFIDHEPLEIEWDGKENHWNDHQVTFTLPGEDKIDFLPKEIEKTVWISLSVDDKETNALPFRLLKHKKTDIQGQKNNLEQQDLQEIQPVTVKPQVPSRPRLPSDNVFSRIVQGARDMFVVLYIRYKDRFNG